MRALFWSDIHADYERNAFEPPADLPDFDILIVAGDLMTPLTAGLDWLHERFPGVPTIYVPGNHDWYWWPDLPEKLSMPDLIERGRDMADRFGVHLLMNDEVAIEGVRFLGSTLWTDFQLRPDYMSMNDASREARMLGGMNDYRRIRTGPRSKDRLEPADTIKLHRESVTWLRAKLAEHGDGQSVVVTHHAPSARSLIPGKTTNWCYASNLDEIMEAPTAPRLWLHGHIHTNQDYQIGNTRVMANPRGYPEPKPNPRKEPRENIHFDPQMIIDLTPAPTPKP